MAMTPLGSPQNQRQYTPASYNAASAAGGMRSNGAQPNAGMDPNNARPMMSRPYVPNLPQNGMRPTFSGPGAGALSMGQQYAGAMSGAVQGYGQQIGAQFRQEIGGMLGNLNGIGALRSGAVSTGISDAMQRYGDQVGAYASQTADKAYELGQNENDLDTERQFRDKQYADAQKASHRRGLGKLLGGIAGGIASFVPGGSIAGKVLQGIGGIAGSL